MRDVPVSLMHQPGELARVARALARYGLNLKSVAGSSSTATCRFAFCPMRSGPARKAPEANGIRFEESEVVTVLLENKAGALAEIAEKLADANVNLLALYVTGLEDDLVELAVVADDPKKAKRILG